MAKGASISWVWLDGEFTQSNDERLPPYSYGVAVADGVYETLRVYQNQDPERVLGNERTRLHLKRLAEGCAALHLKAPPLEELVQACLMTVARNKLLFKDARLRLAVWRRHGSLTYTNDAVHAAVYCLSVNQDELNERRLRGLRVTILPPSRIAGNVLETHKHMNALPNLLAKVHCFQSQYDDAIFTNERNEICEAVWANLFTVDIKSRRLSTPPIASPCLPGTTRFAIFSLARELGYDVVERPMQAAILYSADEIFLTSTVSELMPVVRVDDKKIGSGNPGTVTMRFQSLYRERAGSVNVSAKTQIEK